MYDIRKDFNVIDCTLSFDDKVKIFLLTHQ